MDKNSGNRLNAYTKDYVVFDLETTGLSPVFDEIIEISAIRVRDHQAAETFSTLVNPGVSIPRSATSINGITNEMVKDAPPLQKALEDFLLFAADDILVGHNIHTFDILFLRNGASRALGRSLPNDYVDTLYLARNCLPQLYRHRLTDLAEHFHINTQGAHRALNDCVMNQLCYEKMRELQENRSQNGGSQSPSCPECGSILVRRKGRFGAFWGCSSFPRCRYTQKI